MFDFKDHAVLVTGAGAGIGLGIAQAFCRAGARVALGDLRDDGLKRADGALTVAVANAGVYPNSPVLDMTTEEWDRVIETNMRGVF